MKKEIYGIIHLPPLPGTLYFDRKSIYEVEDYVINNINILISSGFTGCLIQNSDCIYSNDEHLDSIKISYITKLLCNVTRRLLKKGKFKLGLQIMWNHAIESIAIAKTCDFDFVKIVGFIGESTSAYGTVICDSYAINKYINDIDASEIKLFTELYTDHFYWKPAFLGWNKIAQKHYNNNSNGVCLASDNIEEIVKVIDEIDECHKIYISGYVNNENIGSYINIVSGLFISSMIKDSNSNGFCMKKCNETIQLIEHNYEILN